MRQWKHVLVHYISMAVFGKTSIAQKALIFLNHPEMEEDIFATTTVVATKRVVLPWYCLQMIWWFVGLLKVDQFLT